MAGAGREFDVVVYGATGYTGRLVAEHLLATHGASGNLRWAIAGRSETKLAETKAQIGAPADLPIILAGADDSSALQALAGRTRVVATTVGPYQQHGAGLVAACARLGTDYVDLAGEIGWIASMFAGHHREAETSGARIIFSAGFGSAPFDLGVHYTQEQARVRFGAAAPRVRGRIRRLLGYRSGGTVATSELMARAVREDQRLERLVNDPFAFAPGFNGPSQPPADAAYDDEVTGSWVVPFPWSAQLNSKVVHRTNLLLGHRWGEGFLYDEMAMAPRPGEPGPRPHFKRADSVQPGDGPSRAERESGYYDILFVAEWPDGRRLRTSVQANLDPGYGSTSRILAESAVCLALDFGGQRPAGCLTPAAAMGGALIERLRAHAGLTFKVED